MKKNSFNRDLVVRRSPLDPRRGILQAGSLRLRCALGRSGITIFKREGDGATPRASMALVSAYRRSDRRSPVPALPTKIARSNDGWCDAPLHAAYNRPVRLPWAASAESLWRADRLYDLIVVLDWNVRCRARGRGSAIFLHISRPGYLPTEGCVAVAPPDMVRLKPFLRPHTRLTVAA
ncbi:L,D-transpeptidase family protein [Consotaella aegiceratis]|uniref:L,D-transpeptidase family protein n=1 Tax=Consotaella aegiceratis TaxID=3097961 RepID=UPI002F3E615B